MIVTVSYIFNKEVTGYNLLKTINLKYRARYLKEHIKVSLPNVSVFGSNKREYNFEMVWRDTCPYKIYKALLIIRHPSTCTNFPHRFQLTLHTKVPL